MMNVTMYLFNKIGTFLKKKEIYLNQLKNNSAKSHISKMNQASHKQVDKSRLLSVSIDAIFS